MNPFSDHPFRVVFVKTVHKDLEAIADMVSEGIYHLEVLTNVSVTVAHLTSSHRKIQASG